MGQVEEIKYYLDKGLMTVDLTKITLSGSRSDSAKQLLDGLNEYSERAKKASAVLSKTNTAINVLDTLTNIKNAANYLSYTSPKDRIPALEAFAYGKLFACAGKIVNLLPFPANLYGDFLEGAEDFFSNMWNVMDPESSFTPRGRMMKELTKEYNKCNNMKVNSLRPCG